MQQSALVFDLDGTLVDSLPDLHAALNANVQVNRFSVPAREIATLGKCSPPNSGDKGVKQQTTKGTGAPSAESQPELALDDLKQSAQRALAAGVLKQAAQDLRRFRGVTSRAGRAVYCDAYRWLTANEYSSPFAFLNVCRALGFSPETVRSALIEEPFVQRIPELETASSLGRHAMNTVTVQRPQAPAARELFGEWHTGLETLSGYAQRKLRLGFAPLPTQLTTNNNHEHAIHSGNGNGHLPFRWIRREGWRPANQHSQETLPMNKRHSSVVKPDRPYHSGTRIERRLAGTAAQFEVRTDNLNQTQSERSLTRIHFKKLRFATLAIALVLPSVIRAGDDGTSDFAVLRRPVSKLEALNIAIARNGTILQAKKDVEAAMGIAIQTKAIVYPHVGEQAQYVARNDSLIEQNENRRLGITLDLPQPIGTVNETLTLPKVNNQSWSSDIVVTQSIYEGGRILSAVRSARLINEQALLSYRSTVADTLLSVSAAYDDVLGAAMQINVRTDAVTFLTGYLHDTTAKFNAGMAPEFDVLRQTAELGNAEADRIRAIGDYRVAKQRLVELLGYNLSSAVSDDLPLQLTTPLLARSYPKSLAAALSEARQSRTEVLALEKEERLRDEGIITARAGYKPSVQAFAGYELTSQVGSRSAGDELHGGLVGVRLSWALFDGFLTKGKVVEAKARRGRASEAKAETMRQVELQVRTAWSDLRTARAVLDAQVENVRTAQRSLEIAKARHNEGAGTQLDVLDAQSALTQARGQYVNALRDHSVARARLLRATGADVAKG